MQQEAAEKLIGLHGHRPALVFMSIISKSKGDLAVSHRKQAGVGDSDAMCIAREISQDLRRPGEGSLGVYDPFALGGSEQ